MTSFEIKECLKNGKELPSTVYDETGAIVYGLSRDLIKEFEPERYAIIEDIMRRTECTFFVASRMSAYAVPGIQSDIRYRI